MDGPGNADSILECPICRETYDDPRILPCQHTVCEKCLSSYIGKVTEEGDKQIGTFPCPVCKRNTKLKDASTFQKNFTIVALLDSKVVKARILNVSSRRKTRTVTVGTQTIVEEAVTNLNGTSENLHQDRLMPTLTSDAKDTENDSGHVETCLKAKKGKIARKKGRPNKITDTVTTDNDKKWEKPISIHEAFLDIANGNLHDPEVIVVLSSLFGFDLLLCTIVYFLPGLGCLLMCVSYVSNYPYRSNFLHYMYQSRILKEKRWWHGWLMANIELMVVTSNIFTLSMMLALLMILICTFYSAVTDRQSVFTLEVLVEKIKMEVLNAADIAYHINQMLSNFTKSILQQFI